MSLHANGLSDDQQRLAGALDECLVEISCLEARLAEIARLAPARIAFSTSLGIEDQAILHAVAVSGAAVDVFTLDTGRLFPSAWR